MRQTVVRNAGQHEPHQLVGDLLHAEISEKQARSIKYQMTIAKLPLAKEVAEFDFEATPVNETLVRYLFMFCAKTNRLSKVCNQDVVWQP